MSHSILNSRSRRLGRMIKFEQDVTEERLLLLATLYISEISVPFGESLDPAVSSGQRSFLAVRRTIVLVSSIPHRCLGSDIRPRDGIAWLSISHTSINRISSLQSLANSTDGYQDIPCLAQYPRRIYCFLLN